MFRVKERHNWNENLPYPTVLKVMEIEGIGAVAKEKKAVRWLRKYIPECPSFYHHEDDRTSLIN